MDFRIGFYICHCGINIAHKVDVQEVAAFIRTLPDVVLSRDYQFMCSDPGQDMIIRDIREKALNRVVVASCSPRMHEKTFQNACYRGGLNPYQFQMTCVREHCSWVVEDPEQATHKAKHLAAAAVNRVQLHQKLYPGRERVHPDVLVVGGGISGMQAALDVACSGHQVYLVEKTPSIGGHMLQFDKTFPTLDCAACIGTPKMVDVGQNPNIDLLSYSEVKDISGFIGNYLVTIHKKPRYVIEGVCTGCGECEKVCPISRPNDWDVGMKQRSAIFRPFAQAIPLTYVIDKKGTAPCKATCPAHVSIQGYIALMNQGKYQEALELFKKANPFPGICGRVCHNPCELECSRNELDQSLAIRDLHRFLADWGLFASVPCTPQMPIQDREKVAIVGSGPAGLSAAYFLALQGFQVRVFEKLPVAGGMMAVGIPEYRLPRDILGQEIKHIEELGVSIQTNTIFGEHITLESLKEDGFEAVFLAVGLHATRKLGLENEDIPGVLQGVDFLRDVALGRDVKLGSSVLVIGGGNVAVDVARTAARCKGAENIFLVCLEKREEMPAWESEIQEAIDEQIQIVNSYGPKSFLKDDHSGRVAGIEFKACISVFDQNGRFNPSYNEDDCQIYYADTVIIAIGQAPLLDFTQQMEISVNSQGMLEADPLTLQTPLEWVFAGGEAMYGPRSVVEAVANGKEAAESVQRYLEGRDLFAGRAKDWSFVRPDLPEESETEIQQYRAPLNKQLPKDLQGNFQEVNPGYSEEQARMEASRCLECGVCSECYECVRVCGPGAIDHSMQSEDIQVNVGSIIMATGYDLMHPGAVSRLGYGRFPNVLTSLEFERLNNATGPTSGEILLRDFQGNFQDKPQSVGIIHCVGSRDSSHHEYCSRVCCMYALKYAYLIKDKLGHQVPVYNFYIDLRCFGKGYEEFSRRVQEKGVTMIRGRPAEVTDQALSLEEEGKLTVVCEDTLLGRNMRVPVDMVILCPAMEPGRDTAELARLFGLSQGKDGFFLEEHPKLGPNTTATEGIFLGGSCQGPKDIPDSVSHASGAASKALSLAARGEVAISPIVSWIDPDICIGCQVCIGLCAYGAISFDARREVSVVNEALCKGCGSCSGYCPSGAARVRHFDQKQVMVELEGLLEPVYEVSRSSRDYVRAEPADAS